MNLNKTIIVNQGQNMIAEAVNSSLPLIMTQFKLGTGTVNNETEALALTNVVTFFRNQPIDSHTQNGNIYSATCKYNNEGILSDVTVTENGLYAKVGEGGIEKLFAYVTFEPGDFLPVAGLSVITEYEKTLNFGITEMADVQIINSRFAEVAGKGLMENQTTGKIDVVSSNDGIIVNANNITVDTINNLTTASTTKPLSSNQGKILSESKADKTRQIIAGLGLTGGGDLTTDRTLNIVSANAGIVVNADNIELKPATTSVIGGVKIGTDMTVSADGTINPLLNQTTADGRYVNIDGDTSTGAQRIRQKAGVYNETGFYIDATNAEYPRLEIFKSEPTAGQPDFYIRRRTSDLTLLDLIKCTHAGIVSYAGGNYGTINGSTATFSGNVTAPSITIGGYVVTIV